MFDTLSKFLGGTAVDVGKGLSEIADHWIESDKDIKDAEEKRQNNIMHANKMQNEINKLYAQKKGFWNSGARPGFLWAGLVLLVYLTVRTSWIAEDGMPPDSLLDTWFWIILSLLGIRTTEKGMGLTK